MDDIVHITFATSSDDDGARAIHVQTEDVASGRSRALRQADIEPLRVTRKTKDVLIANAARMRDASSYSMKDAQPSTLYAAIGYVIETTSIE
jgi:hypothetical protein